ncbi:hypothetical protein KEM52_005071 [Ascosphaera acerosa]|nr:hypothetical protein KEM52_005071 [Ascosphaera acerosa]
MLPYWASSLLSAAFTVVYVLPFYVLPGARASSPWVDRDDAAVIQRRIRAVTISSALCSIGVFGFLVGWAGRSPLDALAVMGWWPVGLREALQCLLLTAVLFTGPLFLSLVVDREARQWAQRAREIRTDWVLWRNVAPITEEIVFRSVMASIQIVSDMPPSRIVLVTPLYFGIAHVHHLVESRLSNPDGPWAALVVRTAVQFTYTTVFGWYETFLFLRTGSLLGVCLVHSFCNIMGLPRFWGRVTRWYPSNSRGTGPLKYEQLHIAWSWAYYALLLAGAIAFRFCLWPLTQSQHALATF